MTSSRAGAPAFDRGVVTTIHQGDCLVGGEEDLTFSTILGSCISACIRDTEARVGGMNHFLLAEPSGSAKDRYGASAPGEIVMKEYGFTVEHVVEIARGLLRKGGGKS